SPFRSYSRSTLNANAAGVPNRSTWTEWSITRSAGTNGLTRAGSPPRSAIASRITARSTIAGTPVKSWRITRAGMNGISASADWPGRQAARASTSPASTMRPPAWRRTFSSRIFSVTGARSSSIRSPSTASRKASGRPAPRLPRAPNGSELATDPPSCGRYTRLRGRVPPTVAGPRPDRRPMKAWGGPDRPSDDREETLREIEAAGIDLDPTRAGDVAGEGADHDHDARPHRHPHNQSVPGEPPVIGIVGAGAVGTALGVALTRAGWPVHAVASRDPGRRERFPSP